MISSKEYFYNNFDNFGFIITEFTEQELAPIKKEIEEYKHKCFTSYQRYIRS